MTDIARLLAHPVRLGIVELLAQQPVNVTTLVGACHVGQATVSKHLGILRDSGLVRCTPDGRCRVYELVDAAESRALLRSLDLVAEAAGDAVGAGSKEGA